MDPLDGNPHVVGRQLVLARCLHGNAKLGAAEEQVQQAGQQNGHGDHRDFVGTQDDLPERDVGPRDRMVHDQWIVAPDGAGDKPQHETERNRQDDDGDL